MSEKPKSDLQIRSANSLHLHNDGLHAGSLIDQSIARLSDHQKNELIARAGEEALRLEVKSREQNMDYQYGQKAVQEHIDAFAMLDKSGHLTRQSVVSEVKTGAGKMKIESKSGATCFVASVAYDNPNHPDVMFLRFYRDTVLVNSYLGRAFICFYWKVGPNLSLVVYKSDMLKKIVRQSIGKVVEYLKKLNIK